jgi:adenylate cyclase
MRRFVPLTRKINLIIVISLVVGIGIVIAYFAFAQNRSLAKSAQSNLTQQSDILYQSIKNAMLPGEAPIAVQLLSDIRLTNPAYEIVLYRAGGVEAFSDNTTLEAVNQRIGSRLFEPKTVFPPNRMVMADDERFRRAVDQRRNLLFQESGEGQTFFKIYKPLLNLPKCSRCHGSDHTVRGVISIAGDVTALVREQRNNVTIAGVFFVGLVAVLTLFLSLYLQGTLVRPVKHIGQVCAGVTRGNFAARVAVRGRDEIGVLGETVNEMVQGLYERFQLSKFVSSSTLRSIKNREKGAKTEMVLLFSDVRSFTSFSEANNPETVVDALNRLLNVQTQIIHENGGDVDKYVGDEIMAVFSGAGMEEHACRSALQIQNEVGRNRERYNGLQVGIGINRGEVILGMVGSEQRADFTVIGDPVNIASRLCDTARQGMILVSENVFEPLRSRARGKGPVQLKVKGKQKGLDVYQLLALRGKGE